MCLNWVCAPVLELNGQLAKARVLVYEVFDAI